MISISFMMRYISEEKAMNRWGNKYIAFRTLMKKI